MGSFYEAIGRGLGIFVALNMYKANPIVGKN